VEGLAALLADRARVSKKRKMTHIDVAADMHCGSWEQRALRAVRSLDDIHSVRTDLEGQRVAVDDELVAESEVRAAVEAVGTHGTLDRLD
jgi:copper chaperone CopZ